MKRQWRACGSLLSASTCSGISLTRPFVRPGHETAEPSHPTRHARPGCKAWMLHNMHYAKFDRSDLRAHLTLDQLSRSPRSVAGSPQDRCVDQG